MSEMQKKLSNLSTNELEKDDVMSVIGNEKFYNFDIMNYIFLCQDRDSFRFSLNENEEFLRDKYAFMYDSDSDETSRKLVIEFVQKNG